MIAESIKNGQNRPKKGSKPKNFTKKNPFNIGDIVNIIYYYIIIIFNYINNISDFKIFSSYI